MVWHEETSLDGIDAVVVPGGFSYGDYLRAGAIARFAPAMEAVREFAEGGGPVLGICNGFQVLCEAGLLPGALLPNDGLRFLCRQVDLEVVSTESAFTRGLEIGERLSVPVKHMTRPLLRAARRRSTSSRRAARSSCATRAGQNPNGSSRDIAGVVERGRATSWA